MSVRDACKPRPEVLEGDLDDAIFAANFGNLIAGKAPKVYKDPRTFFQNTHPAAELCKVIQAVFHRLADKKEAGVVIRLSTGFGGGKTHTLMAMWHLADNISDSSMGTDLLPAAGRPSSVTLAAIDMGKAGYPVFAQHGKQQTHSLWADLAYRLRKEEGLKAFAKVDDAEKQPDDALVEKLFPTGPVLILLDEPVIYMSTLSERGQNNFLAFIEKLMSAVGDRPQTVLVVTDPAQQPVYAAQAARLGDVLGRRESDFDPIGKEGARVIVRRLFASVDRSAAEAASAEYLDLYRRVIQESPGSLPPEAGTPKYAEKIVDSYPFHPRLLETAQDRLGPMPAFNKSRGTLRLFARIIRDAWEQKLGVSLINAGDLDWTSQRIQADLLERLNHDNFKATVRADIERHAAELDGGPKGIHRRVASALLLESLPLQLASGLDPSETTLAVLRPDEAGPEPAEALERLVGVCWHTYPMMGGRGWQFRYEPNINRLIEERAQQIPIEDARARVFGEAQGYFHGPSFKVAAWPSSAAQVKEIQQLQLVLCQDEKVARSVLQYSDDSDPTAPKVRGFQNAILAVTASAGALDNAIERAQRVMAAEHIERDYKGSEDYKLMREQLGRVKPTHDKGFWLQTCRAFDTVILPGGMVYHLDEKYLVDDRALHKAEGQGCLNRFLNDQRAIYQEGDALDLNQFLKKVLPGATPVADQPGAFSAKAIHERFLSAPGLRLLPNGSVVRETLLKALEAGKIAIRTPDGAAYDKDGCVLGKTGSRRRTAQRLPTPIRLEYDVLVAEVGKPPATEWLQEDKKESEDGKRGKDDLPPPPPPPPPTRKTASSWDEILELANDRPLSELSLFATTPAVAASLAGLAQPLGADEVSLSVNASGDLKVGGDMSFTAREVSLNHPAKPLHVAQVIFNSLQVGGEYRAELVLKFGGGGRRGMQSALEQLSQKAPEGVGVRATLEKP